MLSRPMLPRAGLSLEETAFLVWVSVHLCEATFHLIGVEEGGVYAECISFLELV